MPIRVGIDLAAVEAVAAALRSEHRDRYIERVYTQQELDECRDRSGAVDPQRLAARFAAKEATIKALPGAGEGVPLNAIEIRSGPGGEVTLTLSGRAAEIAAEAGITDFALSLTHEAGLAAAAVVAS